MAIFIGKVNRTIHDLSIFRTDNVEAPSETETSEYPATRYLHVSMRFEERAL